MLRLLNAFSCLESAVDHGVRLPPDPGHAPRVCTLAASEETSTSGSPLATRSEAGCIQTLVAAHATWFKARGQAVALLTDDAQTRHVLDMLDAHAREWNDSDEPVINYDQFCQAARHCMERCGGVAASMLTAPTFLKFAPDESGAIPLNLLMQYISQRSSNLQLRAQLAAYNIAASGVLSSSQLLQLMADVATHAPALAGMDAAFLPHYVRITARKLQFFHGTRRARSAGLGLDGDVVRLADLSASPVMMELQALQLATGDEPTEELSANWFSVQSVQRVYDTFVSWGAEGSGSLNRAEFSRHISQGSMTDLFIARVFEEHVACRRGEWWPPRPASADVRVTLSAWWGCCGKLYAGFPRDEMDLMAFVDFVLAWDNRNHPASLTYMFSIFDICHCGFLRRSDLYTFFREVHRLWLEMGEDADLDVQDVVDEIFDMVQPARPHMGLTVADLRNCKMAGTVFAILANVDQFFQYNYREQSMQSDEAV